MAVMPLIGDAWLDEQSKSWGPLKPVNSAARAKVGAAARLSQSEALLAIDASLMLTLLA